ncbi:MAG: dihydrolipoyl dehydrogenase [Bacteroidia bacterium]|nr:dihydrolipoyl dehydrogenase [Bacteroidia bacterium]
MNYDVIVVGSGPGGYVCAIRCAQLGFKTAIVERYAALGGTCLNVGCIPSKALLDSSEHYHNAKNHFATHGIGLDNLRIDLTQMIKRKDDVVKQTVAGIQFLMKKNKIDVYNGHGTFETSNTLSVQTSDGQKVIQAPRIVIATGSKPASIPGVTIDKKRIITSTEALNLTEIPKHLLVIGGGVIGLEMGSVYARLGAKVTVIEYLDAIIAGMDRELGKETKKVLEKQLGFSFYLSHEVKQVQNNGDAVVLQAVSRETGNAIELSGDYCIVSTGRKPYTENLGLEKIGVNLDKRGRVIVDEHLQTNVAGVYAIGDVIPGMMLAHKASEEGVFVAEHFAGQHPHINYRNIPAVVYTWPEVSGVGYTEEELKETGTPYKKGSFPFRALGRSRASMDLDGFVKILAHQHTDELLGVHIIGPRSADIIAEAVVALEFRASAEDLAIFSHAHPTFTEAVKEAALAATGNRPIHL